MGSKRQRRRERKRGNKPRMDDETAISMAQLLGAEFIEIKIGGQTTYRTQLAARKAKSPVPHLPGYLGYSTKGLAARKHITLWKQKQEWDNEQEKKKARALQELSKK